MPSRFALAVAAVLAVAPPCPAAVVVVANFTAADVSFTVAEPGGKTRAVKLAPGEARPFAVAGPADLTFPTTADTRTLRVEPYNAYVFTPDPQAGRRLQGVELPGQPPERDTRPEADPAPRDPVKIRVTLLVDDADPRTDALWQAAVRKRFDEAAAVIEAHSTIRLEFAGFATWKSDPTAFDFAALFADFQDGVKVKAGELAVGFATRKLEIEKDKDVKDPLPFGECKGVLSGHVLIAERRVKSEPERVDVLVHHLGRALGAVPSPDPASVMRPKLGDGLAMRPWYQMRFDPLNVLAMNVWADELRRGPVGTLAAVQDPTRARLIRVYGALLKARPGDSLCLTYLDEFKAEMARAPAADPPKDPDPPKKLPEAKNPGPPAVAAAPRKDAPPPVLRPPRDDATRRVLLAVVARAKANTGPGRLTGDELTVAYVRAAAAEALKITSADHRAAGFLLGLGQALDDTGTVDPLLPANNVKAVETEAERAERLAVLGNPTLRHRRDLTRRFAAGMVSAELTNATAADEAAVDRFFWDRDRAPGLSFAALAADLSGASFALRVRTDPGLIGRVREKFSADDFLPPTAGLRDGLSWDRFKLDFGDATDPRCRKALDDIRDRVRKLSAGGK
jgi:hypothetical protein